MGRKICPGFKRVQDMINEPGIYIGIGMVLSLFLTETLGVTAGGIIVPGYIAIHMRRMDYLEVGMNGYHMILKIPS